MRQKAAFVSFRYNFTNKNLKFIHKIAEFPSAEQILIICQKMRAVLFEAA